MEISREQIELVEEVAGNAWPAPVQQQLEGWMLRAASGLTRRANSVLALGPMPRYEGWREEVEAFYKRRRLPARYQVSPASPEELDGALEALGYTVEISVSVMGASCTDLRTHIGPLPDAQTSLFDTPVQEWMDLFVALESRHGDPAVYRQIMEAIGPPACCALVALDGSPAGVATAVAERGWVGLFNVATHPAFRRRGVATEVCRALADWGSQHGAEWMYLQVASGNHTAINMYEKLGFRPMYDYHYRILEEIE